jgi:hypothetical protein
MRWGAAVWANAGAQNIASAAHACAMRLQTMALSMGGGALRVDSTGCDAASFKTV